MRVRRARLPLAVSQLRWSFLLRRRHARLAGHTHGDLSLATMTATAGGVLAGVGQKTTRSLGDQRGSFAGNASLPAARASDSVRQGGSGWTAIVSGHGRYALIARSA